MKFGQRIPDGAGGGIDAEAEGAVPAVAESAKSVSSRETRWPQPVA